MNAAGIDVSSRKSTVAVLRPFGEVVRLPFDVAQCFAPLARSFGCRSMLPTTRKD